MNTSGRSWKKTAAGGLAVAAFISFFIFGFSDVLKGTAISGIIADTDLSYNSGGALIGITYFGFFCGTLSSVFLLKKRSAPQLLGIAVLCVFSGVLLFGFAEFVFLMFVSAFLVGAGGGLIDVSANLTVRMTADSSNLGRRLNQLAFFHGLGAILAPLFTGLVLSYSSQWQQIYRFAGSLIAVLMITVIILIKKSAAVRSSESEDAVVLKITPKIGLLGSILFFYMTLEAGISGWIVEYGRSVGGLGNQSALFYLSLFFILLTIGRFLSSFYVDRLGLFLSILLNFTAVLALVSAGVIFKNLVILIPCAGLFMALVFPTTVALISNELGNSNIRIMGIFFSIAGLGGIFGPWMIGMMAKNFSLQAGFSLLMVFSICAIMVCILYNCVSEKQVK